MPEYRFRLRRRATGADEPPADLMFGEMAVAEPGGSFYYGHGVGTGDLAGQSRLLFRADGTRIWHDILGAADGSSELIGDGAAITGLSVGQVSGAAPLASPALTGTPTAPTATAGANTTQIASTAFVQTAIAALIDAAPGALDTLDELAAAMGDDPNFAATVTNALATKAPLARVVAAGTGLSGGGDLGADRTLSLTNTAVSAGSYGGASLAATFTVDAQGRLTAAGAVPIAITAAAVSETATKKLMTDAERSKLAGIAAGAQVNAVTSVAGKTGAVVLAKSDVGLSNVDNTADANKSVNRAAGLTTPRLITVGATGKNFDGTGPVGFSLSEIGFSSGSGANGYWERRGSLLECWITANVGSILVYGGGTMANPYRTNPWSWTFPQTFADTNYSVQVGVRRASDVLAGFQNGYTANIGANWSTTGIENFQAYRLTDSSADDDILLSVRVIGTAA